VLDLRCVWVQVFGGACFFRAKCLWYRKRSKGVENGFLAVGGVDGGCWVVGER
jgi:hypothetical protein